MSGIENSIVWVKFSGYADSSVFVPSSSPLFCWDSRSVGIRTLYSIIVNSRSNEVLLASVYFVVSGVRYNRR